MQNRCTRFSAILVFPVAGVIFLFYPTIFSGFSSMQSDPGDTRYFNYILEHGYQWILGNELHSYFWNPPFFWPAKNVAAYADILLGSAPLYWGARAIGFMPDTSFQLWTIVAAFLNYFAALLLYRKGIGLSWLAAALGSFVFAFGCTRAIRLGHLHFLLQFYSMLAIFFLIMAFQTSLKKRWLTGFWLSLFVACIVLQIYSGVYVGWFLCFGLAVYTIVALLDGKARDVLIGVVKRNWSTILFGFVVAGIALYWMASHYLEAYRAFGSRTWTETLTMIPRWKSWIYMGDSLAYGWLRNYVDYSTLLMLHEHKTGFGLITLSMACFGLIKYKETLWIRLLSVSLLVVFLLALVYPFGISPWKLVWSFVPGAGAIRAVARISLLFLIPVSLGVALGYEHLKDQRWVFALLILVCVEQIAEVPYFDKHKFRADVQKIAEKIPQNCQSFYWIHRLGDHDKVYKDYIYHLDAMWAGLQVGKPTLNGYSSQSPVGWPFHRATLRSQVDLMGAREKVKHWAMSQGLNPDEISMPWTDGTNLPFWFPKPQSDSYGNLTLEFGGPYARACRGAGWSIDEPSWVWAMGRRSVMYIPLHEDSSYEMQLTVIPLNVPDKAQWIDIIFNGELLKRVVVVKERTTYRINVPERLSKEVNKIVFEFAYAEAPSALGKSSDHRSLSVCFHTMSFAKLK